MVRSASLLIVVIALTFACAGCVTSTSSVTAPEPVAPPVEDLTSAPPAETASSPMGAGSFSYLEGTWAVTATSGEGAAGTNSDPSGEWELTVMGESMTIHIGERRYEGILTKADDGWSYSGMITGMNAQGEPRSGYIRLTAADAGEGSFTGTLLQYLDPDGATAASDARWGIEAVRR